MIFFPQNIGKNSHTTAATRRRDKKMDVFKFGFKQWKKHLPLDILTKLMSFTALTADLMLPLLTAMFINHIIKDNPRTSY